MGIEPTTPRATTWCSNQLSYTRRKKIYFKILALPGGLEPPTYGLEGRCSIH